MAEIFYGAHGSGGGGFGNVDGDLNGLSWQGDDGYDDSGSGVSGSGMSGSGGGGGGGAGEDDTISPRRRSYLWKRPTSKPGGGGGHPGAASSGNGLFRAKSETATALVAAATTEGPPESGGVKAVSDGSGGQTCSKSLCKTRTDAKGVAVISDTLGRVSERSTAAGGEGRGGKGPQGLAVPSGGCGAAGVVGGVQTAGITDGGEGHRFMVRGASYLSDGLEVRNLGACVAMSCY